MNAPRVPRTRLATSAVNQAISPVTALIHLLMGALAVVVSLLVAVALPKNATSAPRLATLPVTALRLVDTVAVDMVVLKAAMVVVVVDSVDAKVVKLATLAVVTATCPATAPKVRSATTVVRLVISQETARPRPPLSELATSASNLATFRHNARTKPFMMLRQLIH